jgi:hypothetical protein
MATGAHIRASCGAVVLRSLPPGRDSRIGRLYAFVRIAGAAIAAAT